MSIKYLHCYANWFALLERNMSRGDCNNSLDQALSNNNQTWDQYANLEDIYKRFIENFSVIYCKNTRNKRNMRILSAFVFFFCSYAFSQDTICYYGVNGRIEDNKDQATYKRRLKGDLVTAIASR